MSFNNYKNSLTIGTLAILFTFSSCKKDGNPNNLPDVSPSEYEGTIEGFTSSDEVYAEDLVAYWSFDDTNNELKSSAAPTETEGASFVDGGIKGKALNLSSGYLYYANQLPQFKTESLKSWSLSVWIKIKNNGSKRTMVFQNARPGIFNGNINFHLNTQQYPASNDSVLRINPTFATVNSITGGGMQDNLNNVLDKIPLNDWVHLVLTYDITTGVFNNWANGVKVGNYPNRGITNIFKAWEPNEIIIGSNYNGIPGKSVSADASFAPMTGQLDEMRIYDVALPDAFINALYKLGKAGK